MGPTKEPMITEHQYRRLMKEYQKCGQVGLAALKASMDRKTAAHYLTAGHGPEAPTERWWRTRPDPLTPIWPEAETWLLRAPEIETKLLFEHLLATRPGEVSLRSLRTFYERVALGEALAACVGALLGESEAEAQREPSGCAL